MAEEADIQVDADGDVMLNAAGDEVWLNCTPESQACYYPLKKCSDDTDANLWVQLGVADGEGVCANLQEDHFYEAAGGVCYYVLAGTEGTTSPGPVLGEADLITDCEQCGTHGQPCECEVDGETCVVKAVNVEIASTTIWPECCPAEFSAMHYLCKDTGAFNGNFTVPKHKGFGALRPTSCFFHLDRSLGSVFQLQWCDGTPDEPREGVEGCGDPDETFDHTSRIRISANGVAGLQSVSADIGSGFGGVSANWGVPVNSDFTVSGPSIGDFPCPAPITAAGDPLPADAECYVAVEFGIHSANFFYVTGGTITATAVLDCPEEGPP